MNVININATNCAKPRTFGSKSAESSMSSNKVRIKSFKKLNDDALILKSVVKAQRDTEKSIKMKLFKAMPKIATAIIGTSLAITQPGKLSAKAAVGVGFLMLSDVTDIIAQRQSQKPKKETTPAKALLKTALAVAGLAAAFFALPKAATAIAKSNNKALTFIRSEFSKVANEINSTKLGKFVENTLMPFEKKHSGAIDSLCIASVVGTPVVSTLASASLAKSLNKDFKNRAVENYNNSKTVQKLAKQEFDKIDAVDVTNI